jgi:SAM-dependent methyltransferase
MINYVVDNLNPHLGGNLEGGDASTWCPTAWSFIIEKFNIKSVMDVGAGLGHAAKWFNDRGLKTTAIEGLEYNVSNAVYPSILHDLTTGPFIRSVDLVNCIEVVEHIEEKYIDNLLTTLCQGNYLLMTHAVPGQDGWHHVNCQPKEYWVNHLNKNGFRLLNEESSNIQKLAKQDGGKHIWRTGLLFERIKG